MANPEDVVLEHRGAGVPMDRAGGTIEALQESLIRLGQLLDRWEDGSANGTHAEARDAILDELTTAQAYQVELVAGQGHPADEFSFGADHSIEIRRLSAALHQLRCSIQELGISRGRI